MINFKFKKHLFKLNIDLIKISVLKYKDFKILKCNM